VFFPCIVYLIVSHLGKALDTPVNKFFATKTLMNGDPTQRTGIPIRTTSTNEVLRSKNKKRDDAIRKKVELELTRRTNKRNSTATPRRNSKGTVSSLRPNPAIVIFSSAKIIQAAQLMAAKRTDAVLAVNEQGDLVGILTDKDIAFRVVAEGLDVRMTSVQDVMTKDPIAVFDKGNRNEALNIMISRRFRHLPVISEGDEETEEIGTSVVGLLDITKCVFERLDDLERKVLEDQSIISAMEVLERRGTVNSDRVDHLRIEHECPDIETVLKKGDHPYGDFPSISVKSSVREAAKTMKLYHSTAVLVLGTPDGDDKVGGIFTTKDIVLRVIAASLDPNTTSVIRCMTPHPDFVTPSASILDALKKLHGIHC
jgi:CBS domain-containing protein